MTTRIEIFFEQDGQEIGNDDGNKITLVKGETVTEGVKSWVWITIAIVAVVILLGVGAFFFLEFEEEFDEDEGRMMEAQKGGRSIRMGQGKSSGTSGRSICR